MEGSKQMDRLTAGGAPHDLPHLRQERYQRRGVWGAQVQQQHASILGEVEASARFSPTQPLGGVDQDHWTYRLDAGPLPRRASDIDRGGEVAGFDHSIKRTGEVDPSPVSTRAPQAPSGPDQFDTRHPTPEITEGLGRRHMINYHRPRPGYRDRL